MPKQTRLCHCDDTNQGAQSCEDDGLKWASCICSGSTSTSTTTSTMPPMLTKGRNILLVISDDLGVDASMCYGHDQQVANTPNIKSLCDHGIVFKNAWVNPICSPTRSTLLTGRYGFRTGIGSMVTGAQTGIPLSEITIPKLLTEAQTGHRHAHIGKWHLSDNNNGNADNPNLMGYQHFSGLLSGGVRNYSLWNKTVNGETTTSEKYVTTENVDDVVEWLIGGNKPWFLWLAFIAPHPPFHLPPSDLHKNDSLSGESSDIENNPLPYYQAMIESMDTELGRLFTNIGAEELANTEIIYIGDNGTPTQVNQTTSQARRGKNTLYKGGIHVPLIIAGPSVVAGGREVDALVNGVDVFSTILELAGVDLPTSFPDDHKLDGISLLPYLQKTDQTARRTWIFSELFGPEVHANRAGRTIRNDAYKLIRFQQAGDVLYKIDTDPFETTNLLAETLDVDTQAAYMSLSQTLETLLATEQ